MLLHIQAIAGFGVIYNYMVDEIPGSDQSKEETRSSWSSRLTLWHLYCYILPNQYDRLFSFDPKRNSLTASISTAAIPALWHTLQLCSASATEFISPAMSIPKKTDVIRMATLPEMETQLRTYLNPACHSLRGPFPEHHGILLVTRADAIT